MVADCRVDVESVREFYQDYDSSDGEVARRAAAEAPFVFYDHVYVQEPGGALVDIRGAVARAQGYEAGRAVVHGTVCVLVTVSAGQHDEALSDGSVGPQADGLAESMVDPVLARLPASG